MHYMERVTRYHIWPDNSPCHSPFQEFNCNYLALYCEMNVTQLGGLRECLIFCFGIRATAMVIRLPWIFDCHGYLMLQLTTED